MFIGGNCQPPTVIDERDFSSSLFSDEVVPVIVGLVMGAGIGSCTIAVGISAFSNWISVAGLGLASLTLPGLVAINLQIP
jgi:hypothetical protein